MILNISLNIIFNILIKTFTVELIKNINTLSLKMNPERKENMHLNALL